MVLSNPVLLAALIFYEHPTAGFELRMYSTHPYIIISGRKVWRNIPEVFQAHKMIRDSGTPNFLGLCIPVKTNLKVSSWRAHLCDYFDKQLCDLIEFGFPLDFDRSRHLESTFVNHASEHAFLNILTNTCKRKYSLKPYWDLLITLLLISIFPPSWLGRNPDPTLVVL